MRNKEIVSAVIGGVFFAVPYLALSAPILPSLLNGAAAYGAGELVLWDPKITLKESNPDLFSILEKAKKENKHINQMIPMIDDIGIRSELAEIYESVSKIINTITKNPNKIKQVDNFFDYYLPVTIRIIDRYDEIENQKLSSKESKKFIDSTNNMIKEINKSYKKILNSLYESEIVDTDAEMKVFNSLLKDDGFRDSDIEVKKDSDSNE